MFATTVVSSVLLSLVFGAEITNLPGQPTVSFKQYSGYINLPGTQSSVKIVFAKYNQ